MRKIILFCLAGTILLAACNNKSANKTSDKDTTITEQKFDAGKTRTAVEDLNRQFADAFKRKDSTTLASHYTSDAMVMPPNAEPVKRENIEGMWGSFTRMGLDELKLDIQDVSGCNDLIVETGSYDMIAGGKSADKGKYLVVWKNVDGQWKIYRDMFSSNLPVPK